MKILGGNKSNFFKYFKEIFTKGLISLKKCYESIFKIIEISK